jgi:hypothetical protein
MEAHTEKYVCEIDRAPAEESGSGGEVNEPSAIKKIMSAVIPWCHKCDISRENGCCTA